MYYSLLNIKHLVIPYFTEVIAHSISSSLSKYHISRHPLQYSWMEARLYYCFLKRVAIGKFCTIATSVCCYCSSPIEHSDGHSLLKKEGKSFRCRRNNRACCPVTFTWLPIVSAHTASSLRVYKGPLSLRSSFYFLLPIFPTLTFLPSQTKFFLLSRLSLCLLSLLCLSL